MGKDKRFAMKKYKAWSPVTKTFSPEITIMNLFLGELGDPKTLQNMSQYITWIECTGLLDVTGKVIWEGDILEQEIINEFGSIGSYVGVMKWMPQFAAFMGEYPGMTGIMPSQGAQKLPRIIGNIYQNPEKWKISTHSD